MREAGIPLSDLFKEKRPLKIFHEIGGERVIVALFKSKNGICFFDIGWAIMPSLNPIHFVDGEVRGDGPWYIQQSEGSIARIEVIKPSDPMMKTWKTWRKYRRENIKDAARRERLIFEEEEAMQNEK
jgi:hypothetical protein